MINWQREYFELAGVYLGCRLRAMGGDIIGEQAGKGGELSFTCLGMRDYAVEMKLVLEEVKSKIETEL